MPRTISSQRLTTLQLARAFAAASVVIGHTLHEAIKWEDLSPALRWSEGFVPFGQGVDVFFVISGFIMYHVSRGHLDRRGYWREFARNRVVRIVPTYWFYTFAMIALLVLLPSAFDTASLDLGQIVRSFLFLPGLDEVRGNPVLQLGWTLNYEMFFYALFAGSIAAFGRRAVPALAVLLVALAALHPMLADNAYALKVWSRPIILDFAAGLGIGALWSRGVRVGRGAGWTLVVLSLVTFLAVPGLGLTVSMGVYADLPFLLAATLFVAGLTLVPDAPPRGRVGRAGVLVGDASYSLYLSHPFVLTAVFLVWDRVATLRDLGGWVYLGVTTTACVVASIFAYWLVERPLTALARDGRLRRPFVPRPLRR